MTKERLEELIKQGATIYRIDEGEIIEIGLADEIAEIYGDMLYYQDGIWWYIKDLFETKEQAEWHTKTYTARFERFEPPMWEDIKCYYRFNFMNCENRVWKKYSFELLKKQDDKAKVGGGISIWSGTKNIYNKTTPTKENYEKACEIVKNLFSK